MKTLFPVLALLALAVGAASAGEDEAAEETRVLRVRVLDDAMGRALAGVRVLVFDEENAFVRDAETDAGGEATFTLPRSLSGNLCALAEGYAFSHASYHFYWAVAASEERVLRLARARPLHGRILDARTLKPIADAGLRLRVLEIHGVNKSLWWHLMEEVETTRTDEQGRFTLRRAATRGKPSERFLIPALEVRAAGYAHVTKVLWRQAELTDELSVLLPQGGRIEGVLRGPDGSPVGDHEVSTDSALGRWGQEVDVRRISTRDYWFTLSRTPRTPGIFDMGPAHVARTDARGRFVLDGLVAGKTYAVRAKIREPPLAVTETVALPYEGEAPPCDLRLRTSADLEVRVSSGLSRVQDRALTGRGDTLKPVAEARVSLSPPALPPAITDEDGRVVFEDLPAGKYDVHAAKEDLGECESHVRLRSGDVAKTEPRFWDSGPQLAYRGRVVDDRGRPLSDVEVWVSPGGFRGMTDGEGRFSIEAPGLPDMWIEASHPGYAGRNCDLVDIEDRGDIEVVLPRMTPVTAIVRANPDAAPVRGAFSWDGWGARRWWSPFWLEGEDHLKAELSVDPDATWIAYSADDHRPLVWSVHLEPGVEKTLPARTLVPGLALEGRLFDAAGEPVDGEWNTSASSFPLPRHQVEVYQPAHAFADPGRPVRYDGELDANGRWRVEGLGPGPATVNVEVHYDAWLRFEVDLKPDLEPLELRLPEAARLAGRVVDAEGGPQVSEAVRLHAYLPPLRGSEKERELVREIPTDSGGRFEFEVAPGTYRLEVVREAHWPRNDEVLTARELTLAPGQEVERELVLDDSVKHRRPR